MNQKWPKSDFFGLKLILKTFDENFKKYSLESLETLFASQKKHSDVLLTKKFRKLFNILKFEAKVWPKSDFFGLKLILKTFDENFKKYSLESLETLFASQK